MILQSVFAVMLLTSISSVASSSVKNSGPVLKDEDLLLLEVHLERSVISESLSVYKSGSDIFVPLKEMMRVLSIAVDVNVSDFSAQGWVIHEGRRFSLDGKTGQVFYNAKIEAFDANSVARRNDDLYFPMRLFTRWFPVDMDVDQVGLVLNVAPRESLPLQAHLTRLQQASQIQNSEEPVDDPGYPNVDVPYKWIDTPFVDQKLGIGVTKAKSSVHQTLEYSTFATGDLLGAEAALYLSGSRDKALDNPTLTLSRNDPDAKLLGGLHARQVSIGSVALPGHSNISTANTSGVGLFVSNRPFNRPNRFDSHSLSGTLLSGWDLMVSHNGIPVGFQQSREDGKYQFDNLPLLFGVNDYQLVFHGPLGEEREEHQLFFLDASLVKRGEFFYDLGLSATPQGQTRVSLLSDESLFENMSLAENFFSLPVEGKTHSYFDLGVRSFWESMYLSADLIVPEDTGSLVEAAIKTHVGTVILGASHAVLDHFESDVFKHSSDPVKTRSKATVDFSLPLPTRLPVSIEAKRDLYVSGTQNYDLTGKISTFFAQTSIAYEAHFQLFSANLASDSSLIVSRRIGTVGLRGEASFRMAPTSGMNSIGLSADLKLGQNYQLSQGLTHTFESHDYKYGVSLNKTIGAYALGVTVSQSSLGETSGGLQLFLALDAEPRHSRVVSDAIPVAPTGAVSARVFWDKNVNGVMDEGDQPMEGIGFLMPGMQVNVRTDKEGVAYIDHLPVRRYTNLGLDLTTIDDLQLTPTPRGIHFVPRPGRASMAEFPLIKTIEIDGTALLFSKGRERPVADVEIELQDLNDNNRVVSQATTASDGFYVLTQVPPGEFRIQLASDQAKRLNLAMKEIKSISITPKSDFISGIKLHLEADRK